MVEPARARFTYAGYLDVEEASPIRHEFLDGVVYAMAGGSPEHAAVAASMIRLLGNALDGRPCRVFTADLRIRVLATGLATYPDASVICGKIELDPDDAKGHTATNPTVLVEVLSPTTEKYDRGDKLAHYERIPSVQEIALVAHHDKRVDLRRRTARGWTQLVFHEADDLVLTSLDCRIPLAGVFRDPLAP